MSLKRLYQSLLVKDDNDQQIPLISSKTDQNCNSISNTQQANKKISESPIKNSKKINSLKYCKNSQIVNVMIATQNKNQDLDQRLKLQQKVTPIFIKSIPQYSQTIIEHLLSLQSKWILKQIEISEYIKNIHKTIQQKDEKIQKLAKANIQLNQKIYQLKLNRQSIQAKLNEVSQNLQKLYKFKQKQKLSGNTYNRAVYKVLNKKVHQDPQIIENNILSNMTRLLQQQSQLYTKISPHIFGSISDHKRSSTEITRNSGNLNSKGMGEPSFTKESISFINEKQSNQNFVNLFQNSRIRKNNCTNYQSAKVITFNSQCDDFVSKNQQKFDSSFETLSNNFFKSEVSEVLKDQINLKQTCLKKVSGEINIHIRENQGFYPSNKRLSQQEKDFQLSPISLTTSITSPQTKTSLHHSSNIISEFISVNNPVGQIVKNHMSLPCIEASNIAQKKSFLTISIPEQEMKINQNDQKYSNKIITVQPMEEFSRQVKTDSKQISSLIANSQLSFEKNDTILIPSYNSLSKKDREKQDKSTSVSQGKLKKNEKWTENSSKLQNLSVDDFSINNPKKQLFSSKSYNPETKCTSFHQQTNPNQNSNSFNNFISSSKAFYSQKSGLTNDFNQFNKILNSTTKDNFSNAIKKVHKESKFNSQTYSEHKFENGSQMDKINFENQMLKSYNNVLQGQAKTVNQTQKLNKKFKSSNNQLFKKIYKKSIF